MLSIHGIIFDDGKGREGGGGRKGDRIGALLVGAVGKVDLIGIYI
jgi:hypothetical protein